MVPVQPSVPAALAEAARAEGDLDVLLLFGSRSRGGAGAHSDWDLGYLATDVFDAARWLGVAVEILGTDRVDLVDLRRASGLLRYHAARDGETLFEREPGLADRFRLEAADFWCEVLPILRRGYEVVLAELDA